GIVRKNCRNRKMLNAPPNQHGTQSGRNVPIHPRCLNSTYNGAISTTGGTISVESTNRNIASRPRQRSRENPYAAIALDATIPATLKSPTTAEFFRYSGKSAIGLCQTSE